MDNVYSRIKRRYENLKAERAMFDPIYDLCARFILGRSDYMTRCLTKDSLMPPEIYDETGITANREMAAAFVGAEWPSGGKTFMFQNPFDPYEEDETEEERDFFTRISKKVGDVLDHEDVNFSTIYEEHHQERGALGISCIFSEETGNIFQPIRLLLVHARDFWFEVDKFGKPHILYIRRDLNLLEMMDEYGAEVLDEAELKDVYEHSSWNKRHEIIIAIEPREFWNPKSPMAKDFPFAAYHVDMTNCKVIKESGYKEFPAAIARFWHTLNEKQGRCPGTDSLPSIRDINSYRRTAGFMVEQKAVPPVNVIEGSIVGNDEINLSPYAVNIVSVSGKLGNSLPPISPSITVGDPQGLWVRINELEAKIKNHFFIDRLMDLNNTQQMTLGEANIRDQMRKQVLNPVHTRSHNEVLVPILRRVFNICLEMGLLGVLKGSEQDVALQQQGIMPLYIPDRIAQRIMQGQDVYKIKFISPAARMLELDEKQGIMDALTFVANLPPDKFPEAADIIDSDYAVMRFSKLSGAPPMMIRTKDIVKGIRESRQEAQQQAQQMQMQMAQMQMAKDGAKAAKDASGAGL